MERHQPSVSPYRWYHLQRERQLHVRGVQRSWGQLFWDGKHWSPVWVHVGVFIVIWWKCQLLIMMMMKTTTTPMTMMMMMMMMMIRINNTTLIALNFFQSYPSSLSDRPTVLSLRDRTSPSPARQAGYLSLLSTGTSVADLYHGKAVEMVALRCTKWKTHPTLNERTRVLLQAGLDPSQRT